MKLEIEIKGKKKKIEIHEDNDYVKVKVGEKSFKFQKNNKKKEEEISVANANIPKKEFKEKEIKAPIAGTITKIFVKEGEKFKKNEKIISLSAMKMENEIASDFKG